MEVSYRGGRATVGRGPSGPEEMVPKRGALSGSSVAGLM